MTSIEAKNSFLKGEYPSEERDQWRVTTRAEKLVASARLFFFGAEQWSLDKAMEGAVHELKHALADDKPGYMGIRYHPVTGEILGFFYKHEGERPAEEKLKVASAVGINQMSFKDRQVFLEALAAIQAEKCQN